VCYTTCDHQYQPQDLDRLLKGIDEVDLLSGHRTDSAGRDLRTARDRVYRWLVRVLFAVRLTDPSCLFLLARREIFPRIPIQSDGPFAHVEVLAKANFLGLVMNEAPVTYRPWTSAPWDGAAGKPPGVRRDFRRVFSRPRFGPATLAESSPVPPPSAAG
jgi:hypothetical protein